MRSILLISILSCSWSFGQDTTTRKTVEAPLLELRAVEVIDVIDIRRIVPRYSILTTQQIQEMQADDVGDIMQKIQGVNLKSYGGLGGLKTISVRSLGSQHSAISVDGFALQNSQTGQVNLAQLQTNNIEYISTGVGEYAGYLIPVSSQIAGNNVAVQTFEMSRLPYGDSLQVRVNMRLGSFGQISGYASAKVKIKKGFVSGFGNYRTANGLYPYEIANGTNTEAFVRDNNDYQDHYYGGVAGYEFKNNNQVRIRYRGSKIDQGLPGAVILYNNTADERLATNDQLLTADYRFQIGDNLRLRAYTNGNINSMRYLDPTYFNNAGEVDVTYLNRNLNTGLVAEGLIEKDGKPRYGRAYYFGAESGLSDLQSSDSTFSNPLRQQVSAIVGTRLDFGKIKIRGHVSGQYVNESNNDDTGGKDVIAVNPYLSLESKESRRYYGRHRVWYRNSLRVPTFNELYYNNIGNNELNPERANQFGYNFAIIPLDRPGRLVTIKAAGYFNRITDKIVAIPTQNLFTWSIQNVGIVNAFGGEVSADVRLALGKNRKLILASMANYSFQRSIDMTDRNHPTYKHQIAYIPMHTGNFDISLTYKKAGGKVSNYLISKRYSLNQNIPTNEIDGFAITDFSLFYNFEFNQKQTLRVQCQVKNAFNRSYSYIRSFIMPGRNYLISINYAFN
ncbi:MAG: TonB-dependent receptor plug domain-containing protein [Crocinitomicaceae bacterium]|nr:TonB-dependent receptor plug domain-containing protein [Crocinitomicaceae bacterium]